jgi:hypothetical protein
MAPHYDDQSGDFLATLDPAQLMSMMSRFENAEAAIQGAYLQPVVQTGTIANYNLDNSPTAGGIAYGTGPALAVSAAGTLGQVLTSAGAGTPTWSTASTGTVTSVSVVSANGLAGTVATATTTPAITLSTTVTGLLKGNGAAISAATSGTDYAPATSGTSILYGNGSGGFNNVTIGTGVAFTAGTLSATGLGGTVTSVAALTLGTTGTDLSSTVANGTTTPVITLQVPTASASNRGALSAADWTTFNNKGSGTVTSVAASVPAFLSISGSPVTTSGTLAITLSGTALPVLNGGTGVTTSTGTGNTVLSASPTLSGDVNLSTGNLVIGTAGKGVDFSVTSQASGMTSELFADYEEGTWTPVMAGGVTLPTYSENAGRYTKIGDTVRCQIRLTFSGGTGSGAQLNISGLPFSSNSTFNGGGFNCYMDVNAVATYWYIPQSASTNIIGFLPGGTSAIAAGAMSGLSINAAFIYQV